MVGGGGGIAGAPPRRQEDEQKERAGHARPEGPQLVNCPVAHPGLPQLRTTIPSTANLYSSAEDEMCSSSSTPSHASTSKPCRRRAAPSRRRAWTLSSTCSAACRMSDRLCTRRANCSGAELLGVRWRTSGEEFPPKAGPKRKGLLRWGLKKGVGHPAAIEAAGRPGCSAPATLAPAAGRFPCTIPRKLAGRCLSVDTQKLRRTPLVPADNLEDPGDVAPIDLLEGCQVDGLTGGEGGTRAPPGHGRAPAPLNEPAQQRGILVHPNEGAGGARTTLELGCQQEDELAVLAVHRVEVLGHATGGGFSACKLPIAEVRSAPPGKGFAARSQRCGKKGGDGLGPCVIFHRERRSDIVPRWRLNEARTAERCSWRGITP